MDAGRAEAFLHLFSVIEENNLIRYSSVRRAVSTWIGICNEKRVERMSKKLLYLMGKCLRDKVFVEEQLPQRILWQLAVPYGQKVFTI